MDENNNSDKSFTKATRITALVVFAAELVTVVTLLTMYF